MSFRDREKKRLLPLKPKLFSPKAGSPGEYKGKTYDFCLQDDRSSENLHASIRDEAIAYFAARGIPWHDGKRANKPKDRPSNHLCCSQSACVNFWFPFVREPKALGGVLRALGYDVAEVLPFDLDGVLPNGGVPYVAFEWIGEKNYLRELTHGKVAPDQPRQRGAGFTSLDFAIRFRYGNKRIHIVAGEWKYTEMYPEGQDKRVSKSNTDRLEQVYRQSLSRPGCQIRLGKSVSPEALFFDPFDQLMRQQLLATAMEKNHEMSADIVSLLHVAPKANTELMNRITSPALAGLGGDIHSIWEGLVEKDRFRGVYVEDLLKVVAAQLPGGTWAKDMQLRYGGMA
jgi:hypothetical protein